MHRPTHVEALPGYRLRLIYPDVEGVIDLSLEVGEGVFAPLEDVEFFKKVYLGEFGQIAWSKELEICSDAAREEILAQGKELAAHA